MHGEKRRAKPRHAFHALRHRIADVVKLQIDEDLVTRVDQRMRIGDAAGKGELITNLIERDRIAEPRHQRLRRFDRRHIERDDQALARLNLHRAYFLCSML